MPACSLWPPQSSFATFTTDSARQSSIISYITSFNGSRLHKASCDAWLPCAQLNQPFSNYMQRPLPCGRNAGCARSGICHTTHGLRCGIVQLLTPLRRRPLSQVHVACQVGEPKYLQHCYPFLASFTQSGRGFQQIAVLLLFSIARCTGKILKVQRIIMLMNVFNII